MTHANRSMIASFRSLNLITSAFLTVFAGLGLYVSGLAQEAIDFLDTYPFVSVVASLICLLVIFASSNNRNPEDYHPAEAAIVFGAVGLMLALQWLGSFADFIASAQPVSGLFVLFVMLVAAAIGGK